MTEFLLKLHLQEEDAYLKTFSRSEFPDIKNLVEYDPVANIVFRQNIQKLGVTKLRQLQYKNFDNKLVNYFKIYANIYTKGRDLQIYCRENDRDTIKFLLANGVSPTNDSIETALQHSNQDILRILLRFKTFYENTFTHKPILKRKKTIC